MATGPRYKVPFRRRRDNRTDYYIRKKLLTGGGLRAVVRKSSRNVNIQFVKFGMGGDEILVSAVSRELKAMGWKHSCANIPAAYLTGYLAGKKAVKAGIEHAVLDIGMQTPAKGAVLFATVAGMVSAGLEIPHGDVFPAGERLNGAHIGGNIAADVEAVKNAIDGEKPKEKPEEKKPAAKKAAAKPAAKATAKPAEKTAAKKTAAKSADGTATKKPAAKKKVKEAE
ncbi:MAG: 50S ribosomal protein L18 [Methanomassiliicoccaceae archaeon]|nr:50S ribosomal protein L18 [Methanomassiliicoccaceae archaeon]